MIVKSKRIIGKIDWFEREWLIMEVLLRSFGEKKYCFDRFNVSWYIKGYLIMLIERGLYRIVCYRCKWLGILCMNRNMMFVW